MYAKVGTHMKPGDMLEVFTHFQRICMRVNMGIMQAGIDVWDRYY